MKAMRHEMHMNILAIKGWRTQEHVGLEARAAREHSRHETVK